MKPVLAGSPVRTGLKRTCQVLGSVWTTLLILAHPVLAITLLAFMWRQYQWRVKRRRLSGEQLQEARDSHERFGRRILPLACALVVLGYTTNAIVMAGEHPWWRYALPFHVHGAFGTMGLGFLCVVHVHGLRIVQLREDGESFNTTRNRHGRAADVVMILGFIEGFLGMIYLLGILS